MRILITGGSGLLGQYLSIALSEANEVISLYNKNTISSDNFNSRQIDIRNNKLLNNLFESFKPDIVIHAAAMTNPVLSTDLETREIYDINVSSTKRIAELCDRCSARLIYTSSDLVYAGYRGSMLKEDSKLIPLSIYAETKLMGEIKIQETFDNYIILRIALLYGFGLGNCTSHFQGMYENLKAGKKVRLFYDQYRTPVSLPEAARIIRALCNQNIKNDIINIGGKERVNRIEMGEILCDIVGFDKNLIQRISMSEIPGYPVVEDVSLNTEKLQSYGINIKNIDESIKDILNDKHL
jgi:dTDP-4-dehydrorhamnose reductase